MISYALRVDQGNFGSNNQIGLESAVVRLFIAYELSSGSSEVFRVCSMITFASIFQVRYVTFVAVELTDSLWTDEGLTIFSSSERNIRYYYSSFFVLLIPSLFHMVTSLNPTRPYTPFLYKAH